MQSPNIYDWVKAEEAKFETEEVQIGDNWFWNFKKHVQMIFHLKNGIFYTGENNWLRSFKLIMEPILELSSWTEDIEVKDILFYIEGSNAKEISFLVKKYHDEVYVKENDVDKMIDDVCESDIEYGGTLVQPGLDLPETLSLLSVAFCDQTDMLGGPVGLKFFFSPSKLRSMSKNGWGEEKNGATISLDDLAMLASAEKEPIGTTGKKNNVPGKTVEVYIVKGDLPEQYLLENNNMDDWYNQTQVIAFYTDKEGKQVGVTLYRKKAEAKLKFFTSKEVYQRALGRGIGERIMGPQIWTNFINIHKMNAIEAGSKTLLQTDDQNFAQRNKVQEMENLEITVTEEGKTIGIIPTIDPAKIQVLENDINAIYANAQLNGAALDPIMGKEGNSGTTFKGQERSVAQGAGIHNKRRGIRAKWIEELYRDEIIPKMIKKMLKGKEFIATLSNEELSWVAEQLAINEANRLTREGKIMFDEDQKAFIEDYKKKILKKGNKMLLKIFKDEMKDVAMRMGINIAGKQKDLAALSDKMLSIFQYIFANPQAFQQAMQIPALAKSFENILEVGGLSIGDFSSLLSAPVQPQMQPQQTQAKPQLALNGQVNG